MLGVWYMNTTWKEIRFKVEGVEVGVSEFSWEKLLFTGTKGNIRWVREMEKCHLCNSYVEILRQSA